ncbi:MAG: hypothetical protein ACYC9K_09860 [Sulfuricaulis sp.]
MAGTPNLEQSIEILFGRFNRRAANTTLSDRTILANKLNALADTLGKKAVGSFQLTPDSAALFATAAVEMWLRSVHSFLISASVTEASKIWASVSGYYASHYSVRAIAHLLGIFQLYRKKRVARVDFGSNLCNLEKKGGNDREHKFYWKVVEMHPYFSTNPFLQKNKNEDEQSDSGHRNIANYVDHINQFPNFRVLDLEILKLRIRYLSSIELSSVPIPRLEHYPDIENVQLVAYHRILSFRRFLDNILGNKNRLWQVHRTPSWCDGILDFQATEPRFLGVYGETI